jgi:hypothetical protein
VLIAGEWRSTPIFLDEKGARVERRLYAGLRGSDTDPETFLVGRVAGDWPRSASVEINLPGERGGTDVAYTWSGATWVKAKVQPREDMTPEVMTAYYSGGLESRTTWRGQSLYAVFGGGEKPPTLVLGRGAKGQPPVMAKGKGACPVRLSGYASLGEIPGGDLLGVGKLCTQPRDYGWMSQDGAGALAVERWSKGSTTSRVEALPGSEGKGSLPTVSVKLVALSATDVYVYAAFERGPYAAHFDGHGWTDVSPPALGAFEALSVDKDGTLWAEIGPELHRRKGGVWARVAPEGAHGDAGWLKTAPDGTHWARFGDDLWHLDAGDTWEKAILPPDGAGKPMVADSVEWPSSGGMLILVGGSGVLGSVKPGKVLDLDVEQPAGAAAPAGSAAFGHVGPPTPGCKSLFAVLYKLSRVAPPDFDFPLTREALKGHAEFSDVRFAETEDGGTRYLVAFVPSLARGQKLLGLLRDKVQGARPQLFCGEPPKQNRALSIDLRTGALKK